MIDLGTRKQGAGLNTGNVAVMLGMLESIREEVDDDVVMAEFASTVDLAMLQLRDLQRLAYETMLEIEAERAAVGPHRGLIHKKPH